MKSLFSAALAPIGMAWRLAERHIWVAMALFAAGSVLAWYLASPMATLACVTLLSFLLMRVEPLAEAARDAKAAA